MIFSVFVTFLAEYEFLHRQGLYLHHHHLRSLHQLDLVPAGKDISILHQTNDIKGLGADNTIIFIFVILLKEFDLT